MAWTHFQTLEQSCKEIFDEFFSISTVKNYMISGANFSLKEGRSKSLGSRKEISSERRDALPG